MDTADRAVLLERCPWLRFASAAEQEEAADMLAELDLVTGIDVHIAGLLDCVMDRLDPTLGEYERWQVHMAIRAFYLRGLAQGIRERAELVAEGNSPPWEPLPRLEDES